MTGCTGNRKGGSSTAIIRAVFQAHPDHEIFGHLSGAKDKLVPRLLAKLGSQPRGLSRCPELDVLR